MVNEPGPPISLSQVLAMKKAAPQIQDATQKALIPLLKRGGFYFDPKLYKWSWYMAPGNKFLRMDCIIVFSDDWSEGKTTFMKAIASTGLLERDVDIIKPYS